MIFMTTPPVSGGRSGRLFGFEGGLFGARADGGVDGHLVRAGHREHVRRIIDGGYWRAIGIAQAGFRHGKDQWSLARQQEFDLLTGLNLVTAHQRDTSVFVRAPAQHFAHYQP